MDSLPLDLRVKIAQHTCEPDVRIVSHLASVDRAFRKTVMQPVFWSAPFRGSELLIRHHPNPYSDMMESQLLELELDIRSIPAARVFPRLQTLKVFQTASPSDYLDASSPAFATCVASYGPKAFTACSQRNNTAVVPER